MLFSSFFLFLFIEDFVPKFHFDMDSMDGDTAKAWFEDPETGEREYINLDLNRMRAEAEAKKDSQTLPRHCCLPP